MVFSPPTGTVTFLFTDIEGSTSMAQKLPGTIQPVLTRHYAILRDAVESHRGLVFQATGDGLCAAFVAVEDAVHAALHGQHALTQEPWEHEPVKVRMGIHTGTAEAVTAPGGSVTYTGYLTLTRAQRVMAVARGGQILLSSASANLMPGAAGGSISLRDLGRQRLKSLAEPEHIWQVVAPGLQDDFPPLPSLNATPNNLPIQLSSFIGREREMREVRESLSRHRLVTLAGPGGTGKTRLAVQVGVELLDRFTDGVWLIELAPFSDPPLVFHTAARVLGVRAEQSRVLAASLLDWLAAKELLLILDNCEHLLDACAQFSKAVLEAGRGCRVLATSRQVLGIAGEKVYRVPALGCPTPEQASRMSVEAVMQYPAVRLFAERSREALATFEVTPPALPAIVTICHQLDGIPLAIELAAARVKVLHVEQIVERLQDRFRLLNSGPRTTLPRHQTLRSLIDWSYELLTPPEQTLLLRLGAFAGGWSLPAAERVCAGEGIAVEDVLELLSHLVDKSLVIAQYDAKEVRYGMHETIRQYAREKLEQSAQADLARNRHLEYFVDLAEQAEPKLYGPELSTWFSRLETERDNLRAALEWSRACRRVQMGLRLSGALIHFWDMWGYWSEGYESLVSLLKEAHGERGIVRAKALVAAGVLAHRCGYAAEFSRLFEEGIEIMRELGKEGQSALSLALAEYATALMDRDLARAKSIAEEGIRVSRETADLLGLAGFLFTRGMAARREADFDKALAAHEESMRLYHQLGNQQMEALMLSNQAWTHFLSGSLAHAQECFNASVQMARAIGDRYVEGNSSPARGDLARRFGNLEEAAAILQHSLAYHREIGNAHQALFLDLWALGLLELTKGNRPLAESYLKEGVTTAAKGGLPVWLRWGFDALGYLASETNPARAARLFGASERLREQLGTRLYPFEKDEYEKYTDLARARMDEAAWTAAWNAGRDMTLEKAVEYALQPVDPKGSLLRARGD